MTSLVDIVEEVRKDLEPPEVSRQEFIAQCALSKIKDRSSYYNSKLDNFISTLESSELYEKDIFRISRSIKSLSNLLTLSYQSLVKMISSYEKNIFGKSD